ncbi:MAG: hypothetical protein JXA78_08845 [Anaerolineales bacterium]|nr:hypothetical protein [Anaerolineales bacterium]
MWSISASAPETPGDFSHDNVSDLAIGAPGEDVPESGTIVTEAGAIKRLVRQ